VSAKSIRVLIVDDSATIRARLREILEADPDFELLGAAEDGKRAIELCEALRPDVVTMDMALPVMSGLAATEYIMAHYPTPILIVSSSTNRGEVFKTYEALAAGAVDVLEKPLGDEPIEDWEKRFLAAVRLVARIRVITHPRGRLPVPARGVKGERQRQSRPDPPRTAEVVAIGASTGGPAAVVRILRKLSS
jgi:two-component system chemotaxis response regulator CheB